MGVPENLIPSITGTSFAKEKTTSVKMNESKDEQDADATDKNKLEEGEIFDDYEDIISSDEELSMRKRIEELESRNAELEKIANISAFFDSTNCEYSKSDKGYKYKRYIETNKLSDFVDYGKEKSHHVLSSRKSKQIKPHSFDPNERRTSRKSIRSRSRKRKHDYKDYRSDRSDDSHVPRGYRIHRKKSKSSNKRKYSSSKKSLELISSSEDEVFKTSLDRKALSLALSRVSKHTFRNNLKDRLQQKKVSNICNKTKEISNVGYEGNRYDYNQPINVDNYESDGLDEDELRKIAIISAINKEQILVSRQDHNENESAYSPSDFDDIVAALKSNSSPKNEELNLSVCNSMEISPILSPQIINGYKEGSDNYCTKPVDMDIVSSNSDSEYPIYVGIENKWVPIEKMPLKQSNDDNQMIPTAETKSSTVIIEPPLLVHALEESNNVIISESNQSINYSDNEEEVIALRALLLSNLGKSKKLNQVTDQNVNINNKVHNIKTAKHDENEIEPANCSGNKPKSILKEAVRRLIAQTSPLEQTINTSTLNQPVNDENIESTLNSKKFQPELQVQQILCSSSNQANEKNQRIEASNIPNDFQQKKSTQPLNLVVTVHVNQENTENNTKNNLKEVPSLNKSTAVKTPSNNKKIPTIAKIPAKLTEVVNDTVNRNAFVKKELRTIKLGKGPIFNPTKKVVEQSSSKTTSIQLKRKVIENIPLNLQKKPKYTNSRLIGNIEVPQVKPLIIRLNDSDSENDIIAYNLNESSFNYKVTIGNNDFDNASPRSLQMMSPCCTPRSTSPNVLSAKVPIDSDNNCLVVPDVFTKKCIVNDIFEAKLDELLKNARNSVIPAVAKIVPKAIQNQISSPKTPLAVKHLPQASQIEYRRLVERMKTLEKQKEEAKIQESKINKLKLATMKRTSQSTEEEKEPLKAPEKVYASAQIATEQPSKNIIYVSKNTKKRVNEDNAILTICSSNNQYQKIEEQTKTLSKADSQNESMQTTAKKNSDHPIRETLKKFESAYMKKGSYIKQQLEEFISFSGNVKACNANKSQMEDRMVHLRNEIELLKAQLEQNAQEKTKYVSSMSKSYKKVLSLQNNYKKLFLITNKLGRKVQGNTYSLLNNYKEFKQLMQKAIAEKNAIEGFQTKDIIESNQKEDEQLSQIQRESFIDTIKNSVKEKTSDLQMEAIEFVVPVSKEKFVDSNKSEKSTISTKSKNEQISAIKKIFNLNSAITDSDKPEVELPTVIQSKETLCCPSHSGDFVQTSKKVVDTNNKNYMGKQNSSNVDLQNKIHETTTNKGKPIDTLPKKKLRVTDKQKNSDKKVPDDKIKPCADRKFQEYVSPLCWFREKKDLDIFGVLCPFQLMGQCEDRECKYLHI